MHTLAKPQNQISNKPKFLPNLQKLVSTQINESTVYVSERETFN